MLGFFFLIEGTTQRYTLMRGFRNFKIFTVGGGVRRLFCLRGGGAIGTGDMRPILLLLYQECIYEFSNRWV